MKKFLMLSMLICGAMSGAWGATYNCKVQDIGMLSIKDSNEYLFMNTADYNHSNGKALVCGHMSTNGCDNGTKVFVTGHHYHAGNARTDSWFYECSSSGGNSWDAIGSTGFKKCSSTKGMRVITTVGSNDIYVPESAYNEYVSSGYYVSDSFCFYPHGSSGGGDSASVVKCEGKYDVGTVINPADLAECKSTFKKAGHKWVDKILSCKKTCTSKPSWYFEVVSCVGGWEPVSGVCKEVKKEEVTNPGTNPGVVGKCHSSVCKSEVCKACCAKPKTETIWDRGAQVCQCLNGGNFTKENNQWICKVDNSQPDVPSGQCDATLLARVQGWKTQCAGKTEVLAEIDGLLAYCAGKAVNNDVFLRLYDELKALVDEKCVGSSEQPPHVDDGADRLRVSIRIIRDAHSNLSGMAEGFKVSVWKDDEGKFNTSRLVSDSVAGVVLGTAGGLITSNVVKKNQVENGFEDLKCTIGGQVVADWGDQFRVGIQ